jgi:hypothetical protein
VRQGATYVLRATTARGFPMRVVVDARSGRIVNVERIAAGPYGAGPVARGPSPYGPPGRYYPPEAVAGPYAGVAPPYGPYGRPAPPPYGAPYGAPYGIDEGDGPPGPYGDPQLAPVPPAGMRAQHPAASSGPPLPRPRPGNLVAEKAVGEAKPAAGAGATSEFPSGSASETTADPLPFNH